MSFQKERKKGGYYFLKTQRITINTPIINEWKSIEGVASGSDEGGGAQAVFGSFPMGFSNISDQWGGGLPCP